MTGDELDDEIEALRDKIAAEVMKAVSQCLIDYGEKLIGSREYAAMSPMDIRASVCLDAMRAADVGLRVALGIDECMDEANTLFDKLIDDYKELSDRENG